MLKEFFERRRMKRGSGKLAARNVVEALIENWGEPLEPQPGQIEFVVCYLRDDQPGRLLDLLGSVVDIGIKFEALMDIASGAYVCLWFRPGTPTERLKLADELQSKLGDDLKLVHGSEQGSWGVFTCSNLSHYGFAIPGFDAVLGQLALLRFGEAKLFKR